MAFYDISGLLSRSKYKIFFSLGGRNIGKSTSWQKFMIHNYLDGKKKFGLIVKYKDDIATFASSYFSQEWLDKWFPNYEYSFRRGNHLIRRKGEDNDWELMGYTLALSSNAALKSTTKYQDIDDLYFEEFMPLEDRYLGSAKDPEKEPKLLTSVYQTVARGTKGEHTRKVRLFMISNNYTMNNPYFTYFNILPMVSANPNSIYQRFYTYDKGDLHYALEFSQLQPEMTGIEAEEEAKGVKFNDFRNDLNIIKNPNIKDDKVVYQLTFDGKYIISIARFNNSLICYKGKGIIKNEDTVCYSCSKFKDKNTYGMKAFKGCQAYKAIQLLFEKNKMFYDKLETYIQLTNILAW